VAARDYSCLSNTDRSLFGAGIYAVQLVAPTLRGGLGAISPLSAGLSRGAGVYASVRGCSRVYLIPYFQLIDLWEVTQNHYIKLVWNKEGGELHLFLRAVLKATGSGTSVRPSKLTWFKARLHSAGLILSDVRHTIL
jgi:hypothetical protein